MAGLEADVQPLVLIPVCALAAPILADRLQRWLPMPTVVFEIVLGVVVGPHVLGWARAGDLVEILSQFGLAMLMFLAGYEIDFVRLRGEPLRRAGLAWVASLLAAFGVGVLLHHVSSDDVFAGLALTTTTLGTILPILRDCGDLATPFGAVAMATGAIGEFGPVIAIAALLSGNTPAKTAAVLGAFAALAGMAVLIARRPHPLWVTRLIGRTLRSSGQFAVRAVVLVLAGMVAAAIWLGADMLIGAFTAGAVSKLLLDRAPESAVEVVDAKLEGIGFGFLIPAFFVVSGMDFDLHALLSAPGALLLLPFFLLLLAVTRGFPAALLAPPGLSRRDRVALGLYGATALPLVVVITTSEEDAGRLRSATAAALVGAAMLSVLLFPFLAGHLRSKSPRQHRRAHRKPPRRWGHRLSAIPATRPATPAAVTPAPSSRHGEAG
ncbi:cation:proton antiporter [Kitasatospora sp. NPDC052896]|uniref:cation:proton antiporter n=1 Tax=Kitasatospora sp. NPDC052896 TaxID=3364061 RepID=UPI0037C4F88C